MQQALTATEIRAIVCGVMLAMFLSLLDQTIIATALPPIASDLHNFSQISWVITAYLLASTSITPIVGKLSDLYGRRLTLVVSLAVFIAGSAFCAMSTSMLALILSRVLQGLGGGGLIALGQTVIAEVVDPRDRGRYSAYFSAMYATSSVLGPTLGGILTEYWGWQMIFWINVPLGVIALVTTDRVLRKLPVRRHGAPIDYPSIALLFTATTGSLLLISLGGKQLPWQSVATLASIVAVATLWGLFVLRQRRSAEPIFVPRLIADRVVRRILVVNFYFYGVYLVLAVLTPIYFQVARGETVSQAGFLMIPMMVSTSVGAIIGGRYLHTGRYKLPPLVGLPVSIAALLLMAFYADTISAPLASLVLLFYGLGIGPVFPISTVAAQNAVEARDLGAVSSTLAFVRALGSTIWVAAASALVLGLAADAVPASVHEGGIEGLLQHQLEPQARAIVARAFGAMFVGTAIVLAVSTLLFAFIEERTLPTKEPSPDIEDAGTGKIVSD
jgi:EmrB/QacA subfamily drug resistance transporter